MPSDAKADTSGRVSRWTQLMEPHTARNFLFCPSLVSDFLSDWRPLESQLEKVAHANKLGFVNMETV